MSAIKPSSVLKRVTFNKPQNYAYDELLSSTNGRRWTLGKNGTAAVTKWLKSRGLASPDSIRIGSCPRKAQSLTRKKSIPSPRKRVYLQQEGHPALKASQSTMPNTDSESPTDPLCTPTQEMSVTATDCNYQKLEGRW